MKYQDLYDEFIKLFPEDRDFFCEKEKESMATVKHLSQFFRIDGIDA